MKMFYIEFKKIFKSRILIFGLILMTFVNIYKIHNIHEQSDLANPDFVQFNKFYYSIYNGLKGDLTDEKLSLVKTNLEYAKSVVNGQSEFNENLSYTQNEYMDMNILQRIQDDMTYAANYQSQNGSYVDFANDNISFFKSVNNNRDMQQNQIIKNLYSGREINSYYDMRHPQIFCVNTNPVRLRQGAAVQAVSWFPA